MSGIAIVCKTNSAGGGATCYTARAPQRPVATIRPTYQNGRYSGWRIASTGGKWWATCPGSFNDARAIARHHFARVDPSPTH